MTVLFHGSFGLDRGILAKLLAYSLENPELRDPDLARSFGYRAPFSAKQRSWLHKTGMIELRLPVRLTAFGSVVYKHDPGLEAPTTQWFLHHELTSDPERAEAWHFFINEFLPRYQTFSRADLLDGLTEKLRSHSEEHFGPGSALNKTIARKILDCYTESSGLGDLGFLKKVDGAYSRGEPQSLKGPWSTPESLVASYSR